MASHRHQEEIEEALGPPAAGLIYLVFIYVALLFWRDFPARALAASLVATALFVPLHFAFYRRPGWRRRILVATALLGFALIPFNPGGNTLVIYAMSMGALALPPRQALLSGLALVVATGALYQWTLAGTGYAAPYTLMVGVIGGVVLLGVLFARQRAQRNAELRLTREEVKRLARLAERERIGRDLHDLLGHTLSLVVLKSELAGKLLDRDAAAARAQIGEVEQIARQALVQVREAVSGMRAGGLEAELASARLALLSADVRFDQRVAAVELDPTAESALALGLREAVTNALRHAEARSMEVELQRHPDRVDLLVSDDGNGGVVRSGNGLSGMRERLEAIGGALAVDSPPGGGTRLRLSVPLAAAAPTLASAGR